MLCPPGWRALPWVTLLLFLSTQPRVSHAWCSEEDLKSYQQSGRYLEFPIIVRFALAIFNQQSQEEDFYRLERILSFQLEMDKSPERVFSMQLLLRRTMCRKSERGIDSCPFHYSLEPNNTFKCSFTIHSQHQATQLNILKRTCSTEPPTSDRELP